MTEDRKERCSASMDGELRTEEQGLFVRQLIRDGELSATWLRFHAAREVLRGHPVGGELGVADRVAEAIREEAHPDASGAGAGAWSRIAGLAMAAGLVAVVALGMVDGTRPAGDDGLALAPVDVSPVDPQAERDLQRQLGTYVVGHSPYASVTRRQGLLPYAQVEGAAESAADAGDDDGIEEP